MVRIHDILAAGLGLTTAVVAGCTTHHPAEAITQTSHDPDAEQAITFTTTGDAGHSASLTLIYTEDQLAADPELLQRTERILRDQVEPIERNSSTVEQTVQVLQERLGPGSMIWYPDSNYSPASHPAYIGELSRSANSRGYVRHAVMVSGWDRVVIHPRPYAGTNWATRLPWIDPADLKIESE